MRVYAMHDGHGWPFYGSALVESEYTEPARRMMEEAVCYEEPGREYPENDYRPVPGSWHVAGDTEPGINLCSICRGVHGREIEHPCE